MRLSFAAGHITAHLQCILFSQMVEMTAPTIPLVERCGDSLRCFNGANEILLGEVHGLRAVPEELRLWGDAGAGEQPAS